jgi:hypothetical protein
VVLWEVLVWHFHVPGWLLPAPSAIAQAMVEWRADLVVHTGVTLYETLIGFALSIAVSVPLAVLIVYSPLLQNTIYPILLAMQSTPKVAIAPLLALWIGFGTLPKIIVVFLVCFFPIIVATASGLTAVPPSLIDLIRSLSASQMQTFLKIRFPTAMPHIFVGLLFSLSYNTMPHHRSVLRTAWDQLRVGGRLVIMDAKLPSGLGGDLILPFSLWLMKRTMLGNPLIQPWKEVSAITEHVDMCEWLFGSYYICRGVKL